ncbi:GNAT family N-acetyltransferase [Burkholderia pseudomallei]|nr:GNAT family N-acetyltransferase [Burkholderia pseudomallei]MBD2964129.1 GNAT family N-acetyltransferase [Burkholderia pseudomallei]MBF3498234.1 GNAT family N-acetyltransferase [Burkholderia pseudomallei]MBF3712428.1 GNAT family N-acetyltransferase [Burkholderia pseudomallei]MBF3718536.1 GNAT family N-acetyltransferase [Burkholderia pseudomallei]
MDIDAMHAFLRVDAYWSRGIPRDGVERVIAGSLCFGAYLDAGLVGFARLVADHAAFAYRCDVFVPNEHRGKGDGRALIDRVFAQDAVRALRRVARVTSDAHALYTRCIARPASRRSRIRRAGWSRIGPASTRGRRPARRGGPAARIAAPRGARRAYNTRSSIFMERIMTEQEAERIATHRHYKGGLYRVIGVARHSETEERLVVYEQLWPKERSLWVRPEAMFEETLADGTPRFRKLAD